LKQTESNVNELTLNTGTAVRRRRRL